MDIHMSKHHPHILAALACGLSWAHPASAGDEQAWALSKDGQEVIDTRSGQAWSRCVEGMQWDGKRCKGEALALTHKEALARATARRNADGQAWRVPRVTELRRLAADMAGHPRLARELSTGGQDGVTSDLYWASTSNVDTRTGVANPYNYGNIVRGVNGGNATSMAFLHGWAVDMSTAEATGDVLKKTKLRVRLIRTTEHPEHP